MDIIRFGNIPSVVLNPGWRDESYHTVSVCFQVIVPIMIYFPALLGDIRPYAGVIADQLFSSSCNGNNPKWNSRLQDAGFSSLSKRVKYIWEEVNCRSQENHSKVVFFNRCSLGIITKENERMCPRFLPGNVLLDFSNGDSKIRE